MPATSGTPQNPGDDGERADVVAGNGDTEHPTGAAQASANTDNEPAG